MLKITFEKEIDKLFCLLKRTHTTKNLLENNTPHTSSDKFFK